MSRIITSPVKRFSGTVTIADPLTFPQVAALDEAMFQASELGDNVRQSRFNATLEPAVMACVESWDITGMTAKSQHMPASPRAAANELFDWLMREILALYKEADEIPNA